VKRLSRTILALAVALSIGLHWVVLQSVAWVGMFVDYSADCSITEALDRTFDPDNKCDLCRVVEKGALSGDDSKADFKLSKLKGVNGVRPLPLASPALLEFSVLPIGGSPGRLNGPPQPPPPLA